jgi:hypothetical protein
MAENQCVFIRGFRARRALFGVRVIQIGSGTADGNPRRTHERNFGLRFGPRTESSSLGDDSHIGGSSSSLDTIVPINHENPQLCPYPSSITLQSNGSIYNASFMTSPTYDSLIEVLNEVVEVCLLRHDRSLYLYLAGSKIRHDDAFTEDTTSITHDNDPSAM